MENSKGFTIKCNECGKETIFDIKDYQLKQDNENISIGAWYGGEAKVKCECGNEIEII